MQPVEVTEAPYPVPSNSLLYPPYLNTALSNTTEFHPDIFSNLSNNPYVPLQVQTFNLHSSCISSNSTSDEADEQQLHLINERKQRRMISNRESARRSRMRKQRHLDELWSQVVWLRNENHQLIDKLNHILETHDRVLQENTQLKEEASELRQTLCDMRLGSPYSTFKDLEDIHPEQSLSKNLELSCS